METEYSLDIIVNAFPYLNQRKIINKYYSKMMCEWILNTDKVNHLCKVDFIKFSIKKLLPFIQDSYRLSHISLKNVEFKFNSVSNMDDMFFGNGFTTIIPLNKYIYVGFEDKHIVKLEQGDAICFYNEVRYSLSLDRNRLITENIQTLSIEIEVKSVEIDKKLNDWWIVKKGRDKLLIS